MKKILALLLVVMMMAGLSVSAFAAPSPAQQDQGGAQVVDANAAANQQADAAPADEAEEAEALAEEAKVAEELEESTATDENAEEVVVALGKLPANATDEMKADFEDLLDKLVDAKLAMAEDEQGIIPAELKEDDGKQYAASQPFRAVCSFYPATVTIKVDDPDAFAGMLSFVNGKWVKFETVKNDDGTVTFTLDQPSILSIVSEIVTAP